jgi:hypothetical protein
MSDAFEREQMPGVGEVLLRRKVTSPRKIMALMTGLPLGIGALASVGFLIAGLLIPAVGVLGFALFLSALFTLINVTFASARLAVSEGEFHLLLGMAGPRIPIEEIASVKLVRKRSRRRGMGVRNDLQGTTTYQLWGGNEAVHLEKRDGKKLVLVIQDAEPIVEALKLAMQRRDMPRVRVEGVAEEPPIAATNAASPDAIEDEVAQLEQVRSQHH